MDPRVGSCLVTGEVCRWTGLAGHGIHFGARSSQGSTGAAFVTAA